MSGMQSNRCVKQQWDEWSDTNGMEHWQKQVLISSAFAEDTYKSWYISEQIIPINDISKIENLKTGEVYY